MLYTEPQCWGDISDLETAKTLLKNHILSGEQLTLSGIIGML